MQRYQRREGRFLPSFVIEFPDNGAGFKRPLLQLHAHLNYVLELRRAQNYKFVPAWPQETPLRHCAVSNFYVTYIYEHPSSALMLLGDSGFNRNCQELLNYPY